MNIVGISAYYHDSAVCLIHDGEVVAAAQEERFTRRKHDPSFPKQALFYCLGRREVTEEGLHAVVFYDKPIDKFVRILKTHFSVAPFSLRPFLKAMPLWMRRNMWIRLEIEKALADLGFDLPDSVFFTEHHEAHAASAFFPSPFQEAAIVTLDGVGEWPTTTIGVGEGNRISILKEQNFPHSLGLLYSAFTYYTGFRVNSDEYKVMGLAPYGKPKYVDRIFEHILSLNDDGSFVLNMGFFNFLGGLTMTNKAFAELFEGEARNPNAPITQHTMDIARSVQDVTEKVVCRIVDEAYRLTGKERLCLAGGVALNCVANGRLLRSGPFDSIWVAPAAGDAGGALGSALVAWHHAFDGPRNVNGNDDSMNGCYLGPEYTDLEIEDFLGEVECRYEVLSEEEWAVSLAGLLARGNIVGLFQGRMEFGPRALGNRSILADPRSSDVSSRINSSIKFRESFRPFAPAVLEDVASDYFETSKPSPYMLFTADVVKKRRTVPEVLDDPSASLKERLAGIRSDIPSVTHVDYSARIQTVSRKTNDRFYRLLKSFYDLTGCAVLLNTSLNVKGEPIVCRPEEAYRCFMKTGMDHLVVGRCLLSKE